MQVLTNQPNKSPESTASWFDLLTFSWFTPLVRISRARTLKQADVWELDEGDKTHSIVPKFEVSKKRFKSLLFRLLHLSGGLLFLQITLSAIAALLSFAGPFFLNKIIVFIQMDTDFDDQSVYTGLLYVFGLLFAGLLKAVCDGQGGIIAQRIGTRLRAALISEIYRKSLTCVLNTSVKPTSGTSDSNEDPHTDADGTVGKITTIMSVDAERIRNFTTFLPVLLFAPAQCVLCIYGLVYVLGWRAAMGGVLMMVSFIPLTSWMGKITSSIQSRVMAWTDKRVGLLNEVLQGISIIKSFAWEPKFVKEINNLRSRELKQLIKLNWIGAVGHMTWHCIPILVSLISFFIYAKLDPSKPELDAAAAFTAISLFTLLREPLTALPYVLVRLWEVGVSFKRVQSFLDRGDVQKVKRRQSEGDFINQSIIGFLHASFSWMTETSNEKAVAHVNVAENSDPATEPLLSSNSTNSSNSTQAYGFGLNDLNLEFAEGTLTVIVGATGAGKSSVLQALLGEMPQTSGMTFLPKNNVAYVAQTAFICNATIRENILFGEPYDHLRYQRVISACALEKDFEILGGGKGGEFIGDLTEVGEKGIGLSGGQKQRISLARAAYSKAKYILLDDCLSAVDPPTAKHIFEQCIVEWMSDRTRVLVTHAVSLVTSHADVVVELKDRKADIVSTNEFAGSHRKSKSDSASSSSSTSQADDNSVVEEQTEKHQAQAMQRGKLVQEEETMSGAVSSKVYKNYLSAAAGGGYDDTSLPPSEPRRIIIRATLFLLLLFTVLTIFRSIAIGNDYWLREWARAYDIAEPIPENPSEFIFQSSSRSDGFAVMNHSTITGSNSYEPTKLSSSVWTFKPVGKEFSTFPASMLSLDGLFTTPFKRNTQIISFRTLAKDVNVDYYLTVYACLGLALLLSTLGPYTVRVVGSFNAAKKLHAQLLYRVMHAPLRFFSVTPVGRIVNRFSSDVTTIDFQTMLGLEAFSDHLLIEVGIVLVVGYVAPIALVAVIPIAILYLRTVFGYLSTSRQLKRLDSVSRSPIYALFSETLVGAATIRAYDQEPRFISAGEKRVDENNKFSFYLSVSNSWFSFNLSIMASTLMFITGLSVLFMAGKLTGSEPLIDAGLAGLALAYSLTLAEELLWVVRFYAMLEMSMNAVERVQEYLEIEQEPPAIIESNRPPQNWPNKGEINVENLVVKYALDDDPVRNPVILKNISFKVESFHKVGIVGRTGAGKSSLSLAMLRLIPIISGRIIIDGIDITQIGVGDLRSRVTIIPQDPVLFSGTVRSNLDPFNECDDAQVWDALKSVFFLDTLTDGQDETGSKVSDFKLDLAVNENGSNFSQGQRQLLCLARALLRRSPVIIMDEATASVDSETDARIQKTIRTPPFSTSTTILIIAHRLKTIADCDKLLVLDKGAIHESGSPLELIATNGIFRKMCEESGEMKTILEIAERKARTVEK